LKVKELIDSGAIGDIRFVKIDLFQPPDPKIVAEGSDWRVVPEISGGGYFYDLGSHQLDLMDFLLGPVKRGKGFSGNQAGKYAAEDIVSGTFEFESGVIGTGTWCFSVDPSAQVDRTVIYGSEGHIEFATFGSSDVIVKTSKGQETFTFDLPKHIQQPLIEQVVKELRGQEKCVSTGTSAARANQVIEWLCN
jgi:predicted dehydrogenase